MFKKLLLKICKFNDIRKVQKRLEFFLKSRLERRSQYFVYKKILYVIICVFEYF